MSYKAGVCNLCGSGCGHFLQTDGTRVHGVAPSLKHPVSQGKLCVRGWHIHELLNTDQRIKTPLIRDEKGVLQPATLEEAIAHLWKRWTEIRGAGGETGVLASARSANEDQYLLMKLARTVLGTGNITVSGEAGHPESLETLQEAFGVTGAIGSLTDLDQAAYILVVGSDITKMNPILGSKIHLAAKRGARVTTLCSLRTQIAKLSHRHLQQKPGAKRVVLNALAKALLERRWSEGAFAEAALPGFEAFADALSRLSPEEASQASGIAYAEIAAEAELLARASSVAIVFSSGISGLERETLRAIANLALLTGKMGRAGSALLPAAGICNLQGSFEMGLSAQRTIGFLPLREPEAKRALKKEWGEDIEFSPGRGIYDLLEDPAAKLRALFVVDHDDGIIRAKKAIAGLDLVVYVGAFQNPFLELAHVVLPGAAFTEYDGTYTASDGRVQLSPRRTTAPDGIWPAWKLYAQIARQAGRAWPLEKLESSQAVFAEISRVVPGYEGLSHDELAPGFGRHIRRPKAGPQRFLSVVPRQAPGVTSAAYPFALMTGKAQHFWHQNNLMRKTFTPRREFDATLLLYPEGYVELHPTDAQRVGVKDKWRVRVSSPDGATQIAVKVSEDVQPGTAVIPYFIKEMIPEFFVKHDADFFQGEEAIIPIQVEKV